MPFVKIQGINLHYRKIGEGPPLIIIHGIFGDSREYTKFSKFLEKIFTVYSIDLPMHGKSDAPKKYLSILNMAEILNEFILTLNLGVVTILSHSAGCLIAIEYALRYPLKKLIFIAPAGLKYFKKKSIFFFRSLKKLLFGLVTHPIRTLKLNSIAIQNRQRNKNNKNFEKLINKNITKDYSKKLKKIKCDTTIMWGKSDKLFPLKFAKEYHSKVKNSKLILVRGGHDWPSTTPRRIKKYIKDLK